MERSGDCGRTRVSEVVIAWKEGEVVVLVCMLVLVVCLLLLSLLVVVLVIVLVSVSVVPPIPNLSDDMVVDWRRAWHSALASSALTLRFVRSTAVNV